MANTIDLSQFHEVFFEESTEGLDVMESGLLGMDTETPNAETINNVFRAAHSIKGGAGTFGFQAIADFTHGLETLLDQMRSDELKPSDDLIQLLLESVDFLRHLLQESQASRDVDEALLKENMEKLHNFEPGNSTGVDTPEPSAEEKPVIIGDTPESAKTWSIQFKPHPDFFQTGNDPYRILRELEELGETQTQLMADNLPSMADLDPTQCHLAWNITLVTPDASEDDIREIFEWVEDDAEISISVVGSESAAPSENTEPASKQEGPTEPQEKDAEPERSEKPAQGTPLATPEVTSIRVNIDRVDTLVNLVGELVITQSMLSRFKEDINSGNIHELIRGIEQLEENTRELQEHTMSIRMLPIDNVFQRMPRLVRDLSKSLGKEVDLELKGNATEVDKTVLEKITDPLTHLVRNSLDHGIETPSVRTAAGKPAKGKVTISAYHEGGSIVIQVSDDGRGLNRRTIFNKAVERGVIEPDAEMTDSEIDLLIFSAGFSTANQVSDVSGRGVGMDVVKNNIEQLNGHIEVQSETGKGSTFTIKLPLTLAIIEGQLVRVGSDVFIIPLLSIVKSIRVKPEEHKVVGGESSMYQLEDDYIPVVSLKDVYRIRADYEEVTDGIVVIVDSIERFGVVVDEVLGQQQVVVKSLDANFREIPTISGATILGDGTVAMILDMAGLLRESRSSTMVV